MNRTAEKKRSLALDHDLALVQKKEQESRIKSKSMSKKRCLPKDPASPLSRASSWPEIVRKKNSPCRNFSWNIRAS